MFNCLPGAMLQKGHTHQWKKGFSCSRVHSQHNARMTASHRLFNPGRPGGKARTWLYRDIETIGKPDSFRFRVTTNRETYILELKAELPEAAYQLAWSKVYNLE